MHFFSRFAGIFGVIFLWQFTACGQSQVMVCNGNASHSYHKQQCKGLKQCRSSISTISLKAAIDSNRDPCDFCYGPEQKSSNQRVNTPVRIMSSPASNSSKSQCLALTKKGSQCSREGDNHGYCWQHAK